MKFVSKLLGLEADPRERLRPLWHRVIEIARDPQWYTACKVSDTVDGRFDMITAVLSVGQADGRDGRTIGRIPPRPVIA